MASRVGELAPEPGVWPTSKILLCGQVVLAGEPPMMCACGVVYNSLVGVY